MRREGRFFLIELLLIEEIIERSLPLWLQPQLTRASIVLLRPLADNELIIVKSLDCWTSSTTNHGIGGRWGGSNV